MKHTIAIWVPAGFCAFISFIALIGGLSEPGWWRPAFFSFLPMCFVYSGFDMVAMLKEIQELKQRVAELENKKNG